jgi:hypothetical protein
MAQYWPGMQGVHDEAAVVAEYEPAAQGTHCDWPLEEEKCPGGQNWGDTEFDAHELPEGHVEHAVMLHCP